MTTIKDVAQRAGVAVGTVSKVLNGNRSVRPALRQRIQSAIQDLNYQPNVVARNLRTAKTRTIGFLAPNLVNYGDFSTVRLAETYLHEQGYAMLVGDSRLDADLEQVLIENFLERRVDGLMLTPVTSAENVRRLLGGSTTPVVAFGPPGNEQWLPSVVIDPTPAFAAIRERLLDCGHTRLTVIEMRTGPITGVFKELGALDPATGRSLEIDYHSIGSAEEAQAVARRLMQGEARPTALLAHGAVLAPVLRALRSLELAIPGDVSIVGSGSGDWLDLLTPPIDSYAPDYPSHVRRAVDLLLGLMADPEGAPRSAVTELVYHQRLSIGPACR